MKDNRSSNGFHSILFILYIILGIWGILVHEPWRDETEAWMIARDSGSFSDLYQNMRYQGHPMLWHIGLFLISRFTTDPLAMQIYHLLIISVAVYLFMRYSPFPVWFRSLFPFGYYFFFEYGVISRNYAPAVLLFILFAIWFHRKPWLSALCLGLSMHTNAYAFMGASGLALGLWAFPFMRQLFVQRKTNKSIMLCLGIVAVFGILSLKGMIPPDDAVYKPKKIEWGSPKDFLEHSGSVFWSAASMQRFWRISFWNARLFYDTNIITIYSIILLGFIMMYMLKKPEHRIAFMAFSVFIVLFNHLVYPTSAFRHWGMWFFSFITLIWIRGFDGVSFKTWMPEKAFWTGILSLHLFSGISARVYDVFMPFSGGREVAKYIKSHHLDSSLIIGNPDYASSTACGFLGGKKLYYPEKQKYGTFMVWDTLKKSYPDCRELELLCRDEMKRTGRNSAILIDAYKLTRPWKYARYEELYYSGSVLASEEDLHIYKISLNE